MKSQIKKIRWPGRDIDFFFYLRHLFFFIRDFFFDPRLLFWFATSSSFFFFYPRPFFKEAEKGQSENNFRISKKVSNPNEFIKSLSTILSKSVNIFQIRKSFSNRKIFFQNPEKFFKSQNLFKIPKSLFKSENLFSKSRKLFQIRKSFQNPEKFFQIRKSNVSQRAWHTAGLHSARQVLHVWKHILYRRHILYPVVRSRL